ncbi:MAG: hypothetical protein LOY03_15630 [Cyclobacteriaceae bacterium]|jgi:hypothetical protein|nr:hypothetical protein [Cyclobacteriaceae bacterium]
MKLPVAIIIALSIGVAGCSDNGGDTVPEEGMLSLALEKGVIVMEPAKQYDREGFSLRVDSVMHESRCPEGLECIWAGNVEVAFDLQLNNKHHFFSLNTNSTLRRDTVIQGVRYALIDVSPYPKADYQTPYEDYRVTVSVGE